MATGVEGWQGHKVDSGLVKDGGGTVDSGLVMAGAQGGPLKQTGQQNKQAERGAGSEEEGVVRLKSRYD